MDRRQRKTRAAIYAAFTELLKEKSYSRITVQDIIDRADVGRTTFYAHFETKDALLRALCADLFGHVVAAARDRSHTPGLYSTAAAPDSVFLHLLMHIRENEHNILSLLSCESSALFLQYFRENLNGLVRDEFVRQNRTHNLDIPPEFLIHHISGAFVEMVTMWLNNRDQYTPEELDGYFRAVIEPII